MNKRVENKNGIEKYLKLIANDFPKLMKYINLYYQEGRQFLSNETKKQTKQNKKEKKKPMRARKMKAEVNRASL